MEPGPVRGALAAGIRTLQEAGVPTPSTDAAQLLAHVLQVEFTALGLAPALDQRQADEYEQLLRVRATRIPLQYIAGFTWFYGLPIAVGPGVFVPRPETELLAQWAIGEISDRPGARVVDLCSGSGAVAIAVAESTDAHVEAVESDPEAFVWLLRNRAAHAEIVTDLRAVFGDATSPDLDIEPGVDLITCNPPYVPASSQVTAEVRHDPSRAVFAGDDGLSVIAALVPQFARLLSPGGAVMVEHDESHQHAVMNLLADGGFTQVSPVLDLASRPRFVSAVRR
ncbi:peptide chain release factor N(5)-glutamine methyltransferase [Epidermidibacterium keratini]|uniref:peptide chain release factor N(5)-glutamine methyltransferase n=1 Tax=Epidermidibacterium keratini TaxID=1891644 RepID=A0A7L4YTG3_9ACTN|nr:peptide chain release factor N(5)-glutamine methyltransferase [Epidermidibacterium keratini]